MTDGGDRVPGPLDLEYKGRRAALELMIKEFRSLEHYAMRNRQELEDQLRKLVAAEALGEVTKNA